jgi:hypothetical protein
LDVEQKKFDWCSFSGLVSALQENSTQNLEHISSKWGISAAEYNRLLAAADAVARDRLAGGAGNRTHVRDDATVRVHYQSATTVPIGGIFGFNAPLGDPEVDNTALARFVRDATIQSVRPLADQAKQWLEVEAPKFRLVTSQFVIDEASRGDPDAAKRRLAALENVGLLLPDPEVESLADKIVTGCMMPLNARLDALHVASACLQG